MPLFYLYYTRVRQICQVNFKKFSSIEQLAMYNVNYASWRKARKTLTITETRIKLPNCAHNTKFKKAVDILSVFCYNQIVTERAVKFRQKRRNYGFLCIWIFCVVSQWVFG